MIAQRGRNDDTTESSVLQASVLKEGFRCRYEGNNDRKHGVWHWM